MDNIEDIIKEIKKAKKDGLEEKQKAVERDEKKLKALHDKAKYADQLFWSKVRVDKKMEDVEHLRYNDKTDEIEVME